MNSLFRAKYERLSHILQTVKQTPSRNIKNALLANLVYECDSLDVDFIDFLVTSNQKETETVKPFETVSKPCKTVEKPFNTVLSVSKPCKHCTKEIPKGKKRNALFCCDACKNAYHKQK